MRDVPHCMRVSTADRGQTVENQLQPLQEAADGLDGRSCRSTRRGHQWRQGATTAQPGLDALLKS